MFPVIDIGPFAIQAAGLILILSLWVGIWVTGKFAQQLGTNADVIENSILFGLLAGVVGARIGFFLQSPELFIQNPLSLFTLSPTMLNTSFGLLVGLLTAFIYAQRNNLPLWPTLDSLTPLLMLLFAGLHLANFANGNQYGLPTQLSWGIRLWGAERHPVQIYGLLLAAGFFIWFFIKTTQLKSTGFMRSGLLFLTTLAAICLITVFTRAFVEQKTWLGPIDIVQLLSLILLAGSLLLFYRKSYRPEKHTGVFLCMGSNLDPQQNIKLGSERIDSIFKVRGSSSIYRTKAVKSDKETREFYNKVIEIETELTFPELTKKLKSIERDFKRIPGNKKVVAIDLDILTFDGHVFRYGNDQIPDPDLQDFRYVAEPLAEIAPDFRHPASGRSIQVILENINDKSEVKRLGEEVENGT